MPSHAPALFFPSSPVFLKISVCVYYVWTERMTRNRSAKPRRLRRITLPAWIRSMGFKLRSRHQIPLLPLTVTVMMAGGMRRLQLGSDRTI
ncbi:hypothetical protein KC327_g46 [Hortaea werneckii]|nr:hypothetical protein KC327_g46 [Hortaea werneckii]